MDQTGKPGPATWVNGTYPAEMGDFPVSGVCYYEARAYCKWRNETHREGVRLPGEHEWEKAASWGWDGKRNCYRKRKYPWGDDWDPVKGIFDSPSNRATKDVSPYHLNDMAGNVFEWVDRQHWGGMPENSRKRQPGALRGGGATGETDEMEEWARCASRKIPNPFFRNTCTGFRIARDATLREIKE